MILIADSGSTKTDWLLTGKDGIMSNFNTSGINPYLLRPHEITEILRKELLFRIIPQAITHVYFYGAGCSTEVRCQEVATALAEIFPLPLKWITTCSVQPVRFVVLQKGSHAS